MIVARYYGFTLVSMCLSGTRMGICWVFFYTIPLFRRLLVGTFNVLLGIFNIEISNKCLNLGASVRPSVVRQSVLFFFFFFFFFLSFPDDNLSKYQWIFIKLGVCIDMRFGLGLLTGKFHKFLTDLSAHETIIAGYYRFTFFICYFLQVWQLPWLLVSFPANQVLSEKHFVPNDSKCFFPFRTIPF